MEPEHKRILQEKSKEFKYSVSLEKIKPLLLDCKMFNRYMWEDINSVSDVFDMLPSRGPNAFQNIVKILRTANYHKEANCLENYDLPSVNIPSKLFYKMSSNPLGYCLIINNVNFKTLDERIGSDVDCKCLKEFFKGIGYVVYVEENLCASEMGDSLVTFSKLEFANVDSAIVIMLSHGAQFKHQDGIYGTDGGYILKRDIIDFFSNKNCPQLQDKPKVFFFMACRGDNRDYGVPKVFPSESPDSVPFVIPSFTDILIVHSTLPYNISMRDHEKGTWFCQDLISVLKENHSKYDIEMLMKLVNRRLKERIAADYRVTQAAHCENIAFNLLILCKTMDTNL